MTVARRFIAGSGTTWGLRPGGTPEYHRAYFLVVPPGHIGTATALNAEMPKLQSQALACVGFPGGERPEGGQKMRQLHRRFDFLRPAFCGRYGPKGSPHSATPEFLDFPFLLNRAEG